LKTFLSARSKRDSVNPIREYFEECGKNWDGNDYIDTLMSTIKPPLSRHEYRSTYTMLMRKWLIQVLAAACHKSEKPVRLNSVLIFSGAQGIGKTRWVESLFPKQLRKYCAADKELRISHFRSDNVKQAMELSNTLICNINEIDRLFRSANYSDFKAFLDQTVDKIVLPYGDSPTEMTRRTVFIGSTNKSAFLKDISGNRRISLIHCEDLNFKHKVNIDQLWGQVFNIYTSGERWWLRRSVPNEALAAKHRDRINSGSMHMGNEGVVEKLDEIFNCNCKPEEFVKMQLSQIRTLIGLSDLKVNSPAFNSVKDTISIWSKNVSGKDSEEGKGTRAPRFYHMPPVKTDPSLPPIEPEIITLSTDDQCKVIEQQMAALQKQLKDLRGN